MSLEGAPTPPSEEEIDQIVAAETAEPEQIVPVILAIHNGVVEDDVPQFVSIRYMLPVSVLMEVRSKFGPYEAIGG